MSMAPVVRHYQRTKNGIHALQALLIFTEAVISVAVIAKSGQGDSRINYCFILCWLCIPALIYQTAFPIFERTRPFANAYAHALVDFVYMIFWFAAFIAAIIWVKQGSNAAKGRDGEDGLCEKFAWGSTSRCKLGQATAGFAATICILFIVTIAFSSYGIAYYRKHGTLPIPSTHITREKVLDDQEDHAFSSNPHDVHDEEEEAQPMNHDRQRERDEVSSLAGSERGPHRKPRLSWERQPTPDLPMLREASIESNRPPTVRSTTHQTQEIIWDRQRTPDLPMGEGYYPVDTSYHGGRRTLYDPPLIFQPSASDEPRTPSPLHSRPSTIENRWTEHLKPETQHPGEDVSQIDTRFSWEHDEHGQNTRVYFPDADYAR